MRVKLRMCWVLLLFIPMYLDVAMCGIYPNIKPRIVSIYTYENGEFVLETIEEKSRYSYVNMADYDSPQVEGYTLLGWFSLESGDVSEDLYKDSISNIENYIDLFLEKYKYFRPLMRFQIYGDCSIYPILVQTERLEEYTQKTNYAVTYYKAVPDLEKFSYSFNSNDLIYAYWGNTLEDILPSPEVFEGYTFVGYANIAITPEEYETKGIPKENRLELTTPIDYLFPTVYEYNTYHIYPIYQKNK